MSLLGPIIVLLACGGPAPMKEQAEAVQRVDEGDFASLEEGLALCATLEAEAVRGECQTTVALAGESPACERVQAGTWRDECWFLAAESSSEARVATARCERAGSFREDCCFHLWQDPMRETALRVRGEPAAVVVSAGQARWEALSSSPIAPCLRQERYWSELFRAVHEREEPVDLRWCAEVGPELRGWCQEGLGRVASSRLERAVPGRPVHAELCLSWRAGEREQALERIGCLGCTEALAERVDVLCR